MKIASSTSLIKHLTKLISPILKMLFPNLNKKSQAYEEISMNVTANILGLGNAATPLGLKAMNTLQKENKNKSILSNEMVMFIVLNTASLQIIPTTVIALRVSLGSTNPTNILVPIWIATFAAAFAGIFATKILMKKY
jgi:spore maturation protein A